MYNKWRCALSGQSFLGGLDKNASGVAGVSGM
jgi:hypothetical protein